MATVIRMKRGGRTHAPYYRVVVMDSRTRNRGTEIEQIGVYHPCARPEPRLDIDAPRALGWLYKGAKPSDTVRNVFSDRGIMKAFAEGVKPEDMQPAPVEAAAATESPAPEAEAAAPEPEAEAPSAESESAPEVPADETEA
jgi:small subunit ribosomal protein S16